MNVIVRDLVQRMRYAIWMRAFLTAIVFHLVTVSQAHAQPSQSVVIPVAIFPISGVPSKGVSGAAAKQELADASAATQKLAKAINTSAHKGYSAFALPCDKPADCDLATAKIYVAISKTDAGLAVQSIDVATGHIIAPLTKQSVAEIGGLSASEINQLLGTAVFVNGDLTVQHGYQQLIQIVADPQNPGDIDAVSMMIHALAQHSLAARPSEYTIGQLNNAQLDAATCAHGEQYLLLTLTIDQDARKLIGHTRIGASTSGFLHDCASGRTFTFSGDEARGVPTTAASFLSWATILKLALFPKFDWADIGAATGAISGFVDVNPASADVRARIAQGSLQQAADNLCKILETTQEPNPAASSQPSSAFGVMGANGAPGGPSVNPANFLASSPYPLQCSGSDIHVLPAAPSEYQGLLDRWKVSRPGPTPPPDLEATPTAMTLSVKQSNIVTVSDTDPTGRIYAKAMDSSIAVVTPDYISATRAGQFMITGVKPGSTNVVITHGNRSMTMTVQVQR